MTAWYMGVLTARRAKYPGCKTSMAVYLPMRRMKSMYGSPSNRSPTDRRVGRLLVASAGMRWFSVLLKKRTHSTVA